jgi:aminoglycoside phosphotransferase (APT) family kinase protein
MPEIAVDEDLIHRLLDEQFPDLAGLAVRKVARGWDNELWRLGEDLAVRIPMLERAPEMLRKEYQWVPGLAAALPLPVPVPLRLGPRANLDTR